MVCTFLLSQFFKHNSITDYIELFITVIYLVRIAVFFISKYLTDTSYDKICSMKHTLSCAAQDLLEAAIIQKRRLNLQYLDDSGHVVAHPKVLPVDIFTSHNEEQLLFMATDNKGGIIKLSINTAYITAFEADDFLDPRIIYKSDSDDVCGIQ